MSTRVDTFDDYDGPVFEKLAHHRLPTRHPRYHAPVVGMVQGPVRERPRYRTPAQRARLKTLAEDRRQAKQEREARRAAEAAQALQDHFNRRRGV